MPEKKLPLARRVRPSVPITLELDQGQQATFRLSFDFNAIVRIEEKTGLRMLNVYAPWAGLSATVLSVMLWAAMLANHPEYDSDEGLAIVRSFLDPENADRATQSLWEAYLLYLPERQAKAMRQMREDAEKAQKAENPPPPATPTQVKVEAPPASEGKNSIGSDSGPSPDTTSASASESSAS